ncbi:cytochrome P450 1B1 [Polypterus senegalus]|nr:cytochrome P450 1B1 [Polypterus senegalus]
MALYGSDLGANRGGGPREWGVHVQPALLASFLFLIFLEACLWVRNLRQNRRLPGPFAWPVVGNAMQLGSLPHLTFSRLAKKYGNVFQLRLGSSEVVVLNGDAIIRQALIRYGAEFAGRPNFTSFQLVSGGKSMVFGSYNTVWKKHRRIALSSIRTFSTANSQTKKRFEAHVMEEALELIQTFIHQTRKHGYFEPTHELTVAAANVICALCFGKRYCHEDMEFKALLGKVNRFGETVSAGSLVDTMPWLQAFPNPIRRIYKDFKDLNREFFEFVKDKIIQHRQTFNPEVTRDMSDAIISVIEHGTRAEDGLTKEHVEGTVNDLLGAGQDTISASLHWILLLLIKYPHIQVKLQRLIDAEVGRDRLPTFEDKSKLAYLEAFIFETMRFTSFVPVTIPHCTTCDVMIDGLHIPKDTVVFINQWSVNHDESKWKNPEVFDPSRFLDDEGAIDRDLTNSVMIFSIGKRRCIGDQIAKLQVFLFTAILLHQCTFEANPADKLTLDCTYSLTLRPLHFTMSVKPREDCKDKVSTLS